nr:MAG TPA: zinc finger domain protein [Caudoviricetes sp.]
MLKQEQKVVDNTEVTKTFIQCPFCGVRFGAYYDTQSTLVLKKQIRKHTAKLQMIRDEHQYKKELKAVEKKQKRLERETRILETKYNKEF